MSIFEQQKYTNSGKLLEKDKDWIIYNFWIICDNQSIHQSSHQAIFKSSMFPHSPTTCHSQNTPQISELSIPTKGYTHIQTQIHSSQRPPTLPLLTRTPHFNFKTGVFCHAVTQSSHPVLVREREIYRKRRWNWKQQMSERVCQREMSPTLLPLNKLHTTDWLTLLPQSDWNKWKKETS